MYAGRLHTGQGYARETAETPREHPEWHRGMMASCRRRTLFAPNWYEQDRQRGTTERRYAVARALVPLLLSGQITTAASGARPGHYAILVRCRDTWIDEI